MFVAVLGITAGLLQALGYFFYIKIAREGLSAPNPLSWIMWAYGTSLIGLLEFSQNASPYLLVLPAACSASSIYVAIRSWQYRKLENLDWNDWFAFSADVLLTICYTSVWLLAKYGMLSPEKKSIATLSFLLLSNATTFTTFWPTLKGIMKNPQGENWVPWTVWTLAYTTLAIATLMQNGAWTVFMLYPVLNLVMHGLTALLTRPGRQTNLRGHAT